MHTDVKLENGTDTKMTLVLFLLNMSNILILTKRAGFISKIKKKKLCAKVK